MATTSRASPGTDGSTPNGDINPINLPTLYIPLDDGATPQNLFPPGTTKKNGHCDKGKCMTDFFSANFNRFICRHDPHAALIYTNGSCLNNGQPNARGGIGFVHRGPGTCSFTGRHITGDVSMRLEDEGPTGERYAATNNRAELRAVLAVLQYRVWTAENIHKLVIATDSEYVTKGSTEWLRGWVNKGWRNAAGRPVMNQDLWKALLAEFLRWHGEGLEIQFWRIPRALNTVADAAADRGAYEEQRPNFGEILGGMYQTL